MFRSQFCKSVQAIDTNGKFILVFMFIDFHGCRGSGIDIFVYFYLYLSICVVQRFSSDLLQTIGISDKSVMNSGREDYFIVLLFLTINSPMLGKFYPQLSYRHNLPPGPPTQKS